MNPKSFRDLEVWQRAMTLAEEAYTIAGQLPKSELFGLSQQIRKSAISIPSNIAEGKQHPTAGYIHFLRIARGSEAELQTQLELTTRLGFLSKDQVRHGLEVASEVGRMLNGLIRSLKGSDP